MSQPTPTADESILTLLGERGVLSSAGLAIALGIPERRIRRRLSRLIRDGYVFSPERGRYRITAFGAAVLEPIGRQPDRVDDPDASRINPWRKRRRK